MTSRQFRVGGLVLSAAFAALGIWVLAEAKYGTGAFWLVVSAMWLLLAFFRNNVLQRAQERRQRLEAKYASQPFRRSRRTYPVGAVRITRLVGT